MKYASVLALGAAAVAGTAQADIVPGKFIAKLAGSNCASEVASVQALKTVSMGEAAARAEPVKALEIVDSCFAVFTGNDALRAQVEGKEGTLYVVNDETVQVNIKSWGIDRIDQPNLPLDGASFKGAYDGSGQTIYIIDTGINKDHVDFGGRASYGASFIDGEGDADQNGHGSHCAGSAAGGSYGVARRAKVKGVKVLSGQGSGTFAGILDGIKWAVADASGPSVLSMSLGGGRNQAMNDAAVSASNGGHIVVVAAGNDSADACSYSPAGAGGKGSVITVGSTARNDAMSSFSNYGSCTDIYAPGTDITSAWKGGSSASKTISGTSMACPHVAGVASVLLQKHNGNKAAAVAELYSLSVSGKISGLPSGPNKLLQVPTSGGNPTRPPTRPPSRNPVVSPTSGGMECVALNPALSCITDSFCRNNNGCSSSSRYNKAGFCGYKSGPTRQPVVSPVVSPVVAPVVRPTTGGGLCVAIDPRASDAWCQAVGGCRDGSVYKGSYCDWSSAMLLEINGVESGSNLGAILGGVAAAGALVAVGGVFVVRRRRAAAAQNL